MIILLDMDGTVCDFVGPVLDKYNKEFDDTLTHDDITAYGMHEVVKPECGRSIYKYYHSKGTFLDLPLLPGAKDAIHQLLLQGNDIYFVTKPVDFSLYCMKEKQQWVDKHFPEISYRNMIFTENKHMVIGDVLVDDHIYNLTKFKGTRVVLDAPWNRDASDTALNLKRVFNWNELLYFLTDLSTKGRVFC